MQIFKNILCVVAAESGNEAALERAAALANTNQARLTVVEVIDEIPPNTKLLDRVLFPEIKAKILEVYRKGLEELVAPWNKHVEIQTKLLVGIGFLEIIREVLRNGCDLVIKTTESSELLDRVFGSNDMHLLRKCPCPVWLVNSKSPKAYRRILAAVDVDDCYESAEINTRNILNHQIIETASSLALSEFAKLHIVHAWKAIGEDEMRAGLVDTPEEKIVAYVEEMELQHRQNLNTLMDDTIGGMEQIALENINPNTHLLKGSPRKVIPAFADEIEADLLVMGTVSRTGIPGFFMGNTAEAIYYQINCSVFAIKPSGFETPVTIEA